jgi:hypothetical protein
LILEIRDRLELFALTSGLLGIQGVRDLGEIPLVAGYFPPNVTRKLEIGTSEV